MILDGTSPKTGNLNGVPYHRNDTPPGVETQEVAYSVALTLVARIDEELTQGIRHYRDRAGRLLTRLDEVIRAILANDLSLPDDEPREERV